MTRIIDHLKSRLNDYSFWAGITLAITAASALPKPWNYYSMAAGVIGSLVGGQVKKDAGS